MSVNSTNPSELFGGTWETWGSGRVPVGIDTTQTEFSEIEQTGGYKINPELNCGAVNYGFEKDTPYYSERTIVRKNAISMTHNDEISAEISNLQPYITCYMWKRIV